MREDRELAGLGTLVTGRYQGWSSRSSVKPARTFSPLHECRRAWGTPSSSSRRTSRPPARVPQSPTRYATNQGLPLEPCDRFLSVGEADG